MTKMGRATIPFDWETVDELLIAGCIGTEVAAHFGIHPDTLYNRVSAEFGMTFSAYAASKKGHGDAHLRKAQYKKAVQKLDNTMLIWLGKQRLGQKENPGEHVVSEDILKAFNELMLQLDKAQSEKKAEKGSEKNEDGAENNQTRSVQDSPPDFVASLKKESVFY